MISRAAVGSIGNGIASDIITLKIATNKQS